MTGHLGWTDWNLEPTVSVGLVALVAGYGLAVRKRWLSAEDDVSPWFGSTAWRPACLAVGVLVAVIALESPIDKGGDDYLFSIHMVQHLLLMMVAPPLILLSMAGARRLSDRHAPRWLHAAWDLATLIWPATLLFNAVLLVWHIPALYESTLTTEPIHVFEHLTFIAVGVLFWWPIVDPLRRPGSSRRITTAMQKVAMLTVAGVPPTLLGLIFAMAHTPLYVFYARAPRLWGLSPVTDQQWAGVIMFGLGNIIYFMAISIIFLRLFADPARDELEAATLVR